VKGGGRCGRGSCWHQQAAGQLRVRESTVEEVITATLEETTQNATKLSSRQTG
jgi:hypothetical protein